MARVSRSVNEGGHPRSHRSAARFFRGLRGASYGADFVEQSRRAAHYFDRIQDNSLRSHYNSQCKRTQSASSGEQFQLQTLTRSRHMMFNPHDDLSDTSRLRPDLARSIGAYRAYLPTLLNLQEGRV